jgi:sugar porter (SP) family MFS transporter
MFVVLTAATNGYDGSMVNGLQSLAPWQDYFHHPTGSLLGLFACIMSVGSLVALPVVPYTADILGRRWGIIIGCLIMILGVILQSISINFRMFIAARFFIGFGVAIAHGASPLLITELVHPQHRATFTTIYNTTWYLGSIVAAWLTFGTNHVAGNWSWRIPSIVQAFPSLIQLAFVWFVPESPRWMVAHGRVEQAHRTLAKVHANGNMDDEVVILELQEIKDTLKLEQEFEGNGWMELIRTKGNRRRLLILMALGLFSQWSGNGLASYYLNLVLNNIGITNGNTQLVINGCLQILNLIVALGQCFVVDYFGRRTLFLVSTSGMLVAFIIWTACAAEFAKHHIQAAGNTVIAMIYIYYVFYNMAWSGLLVGYGAEILPYKIRAKGLTIMFLMVDIALFFNQYVNPIALNHLEWKYYIVYCAWLAVELVVVYFLFIETRYTPLEEIAKHFDGEDAIVGGAVATEKARHLAAEIGGLDTVDLGEKSQGAVEQREL